MAGTVVVTEEGGTVRKVRFDWTSDGAGAADGVTGKAFSGSIERLVTIPGTAGDAPTDLYDAVLNDEDGGDVLMGAGANRSATVTQQVLNSSLGIVANDKLTLGITAAGAAKKGVLIAYIR